MWPRARRILNCYRGIKLSFPEKVTGCVVSEQAIFWRTLWHVSAVALPCKAMVGFRQHSINCGSSGLYLWKACHSHKNMHVETAVVTVVGARLLGQLYSMCAFLRSNANWGRLHRSLTQWAACKVDASGWLPCPPSLLSIRFRTCIVSYYDEATRHQSDDIAPRRRRRFDHGFKLQRRGCRSKEEQHARYIATMRQFLTDDYNCLGDSAVVHNCTGPTCCPAGPRSPLQSRLVRGVKSVVLPRVPEAPVAGKWTKLTPSLQSILFGVLIRLWKGLWETAFAALTFRVRVNGFDDEDEGRAHGCEVDFAALSGKGYRRASSLIGDVSRNVGLILLAVCLEPVRSITDFFILCSSDSKDVDAPPYILDLFHTVPRVLILRRHDRRRRGSGESVDVLAWVYKSSGVLGRYCNRSQ